MAKRAVLFIVGSALILLTMRPVVAHHSFNAQYEMTRTERLEGRVVQVDWMNPHVYVQMEVPDASGKGPGRTWKIELSPPHNLMRNGWSKDSVRPGMEIAVDGFRAIDGSLSLGSTVVTVKATGQVLNTPVTPWGPATQ